VLCLVELPTDIVPDDQVCSKSPMILEASKYSEFITKICSRCSLVVSQQVLPNVFKYVQSFSDVCRSIHTLLKDFFCLIQQGIDIDTISK
jgi:phosphatidylinositol kinase/protein kinase (PI-3  family)